MRRSDGPRRAAAPGLARVIDGFGHLVEPDDPADARHGSSRPRRRHRGAVPVLRHRAATELHSQALARGPRDVQRAPVIPTAGEVDSSHEIASLDDPLSRPCADAFEDDRSRLKVVGPNVLAIHRMGAIRRVDQDVRAERPGVR